MRRAPLKTLALATLALPLAALAHTGADAGVHHHGLLAGFMHPLTGADRLRLEKSRLEAFLDAMPGQYCGFAQDGAVIYSTGFCRLLGLDTVKHLEDIQSKLATSDAAAARIKAAIRGWLRWVCVMVCWGYGWSWPLALAWPSHCWRCFLHATTQRLFGPTGYCC